MESKVVARFQKPLQHKECSIFHRRWITT